MDEQHKRTATLRSLISKWHLMRQKAVPENHLLHAMANDINDGIPQIPSDKIYHCWMEAKSQSDFMPMDATLIRAWNEKINTARHNPNGRIEYKPAHSCRYCVVVALRLGVNPHDATEWEREESKLGISQGEIACVRSAKPEIVSFWSESTRSPYMGML